MKRFLVRSFVLLLVISVLAPSLVPNVVTPCMQLLLVIMAFWIMLGGLSVHRGNRRW